MIKKSNKNTRGKIVSAAWRLFYEQGYELTVTLDEKELTGVGVYAFGVMLKNLISDYCAINLPIKFKIRGVERGEIATWDQDSI